MNHKRGRPKSTRAGCLLCKPHKAGLKGIKDEIASVRRRLQVKVPNPSTTYVVADDEFDPLYTGAVEDLVRGVS